MLEFTDTPQHYPQPKAADKRRRDFNEIYAAFDPAEAAVQAARCSQCGIPFCQIHCPLANNIPDWLKLTAEGRLEEAYAISSATNTFPEICGRICPQDKLCEGNCVIEKGFKSVTIGAVEKYITETAFAEGWVKPIVPARETGFSVGIIGAGPAGLAAADMLRRNGHAVHVYDRYDRVGGLLIYGIPNFKLEKHIVARRHRLLEDGGITFHLNHDVRNIGELRAKHDAALIATGVYKAREIDIPGGDLENIFPAMTYLTAGNRTGLGDNVPEFESGRLNAEGKKIVVIGGGDTAMDCVRTAVRQGARSVTCLYRRDRANMPGSAREVKNAEEEGVQFLWLSAPRAFAGKKSVNQILAQRMRLIAHDASGRQAVVPAPGETFALPCDMAIKALGFDAEDLPALFAAPELKVSKYGTIAINRKNFETSLPGVFAAGDIVRGASLVVWAIKDGREAAAAIHQHLATSERAAA
ncbi:MAG: NAD(P)-dependent oxidoreductase [Pseudomonadota bacterium]|nr:NAD(P)-dependent oxidoreductase [Pseudomonadota bacterium]MDE3037210.1 NAD(P)-dependent oxidoreductase [Pseudomonadota bacterium]